MTGRHHAHRGNAHEETLRLRPVRPAAPRKPKHAAPVDPWSLARLAWPSEDTGRLLAVLRGGR